MLTDSHAHIDMLNEEELATALKEAQETNVSKIVSCSTSFPSNMKNLELAKKFPQIKAAIGLYPLDAIELNEMEIDKAFYFFEAEISKAIAIGEVGLDFKHAVKENEQQKQQKIFERFISLSNTHSLPLIIHSRFAQRQVLEVLKKEKAEKALLHSYTDSLKLMKQAADNDYFVSVGLNVLTNEQTQKNIASFALENLLFETDSPIRFNGEKANPAKIALIAQKVAQIKDISIKDVEKQAAKNFEKLFGK